MSPSPRPGSVDLNRVAVFLRVVELESFTAAAEALGLPKSSVSRSVARLEEELGVQLLQRTTRSVTLTEAGAAYAREAGRAVAALQDAQAAVSQLDGKAQGTVRLTAPVDLGVRVLAEPAADFVRRNPGLSLDFVLTGRVVNLVDEGVDLAVRAGTLRDSSLVARKAATIDAWLVASPTYLDRRGTPTRVEELQRHACVAFRPRRGTAEWALAGPSGSERVAVTGPLGADDFTFVHEVVKAGAGIGLLPALTCERDVEQGRLVRVLAPWVGPGAPVHVVWPAARHVPRRVLLVREWLIQTLGSARPLLSRGE